MTKKFVGTLKAQSKQLESWLLHQKSIRRLLPLVIIGKQINNPLSLTLKTFETQQFLTETANASRKIQKKS